VKISAALPLKAARPATVSCL